MHSEINKSLSFFLHPYINVVLYEQVFMNDNEAQQFCSFLVEQPV
jgi:hypothetical protein